MSWYRRDTEARTNPEISIAPMYAVHCVIRTTIRLRNKKTMVGMEAKRKLAERRNEKDMGKIEKASFERPLKPTR